MIDHEFCDDGQDTPSICDRCSCDVFPDEMYTGDPGTEYEGCVLCAVCHDETKAASQPPGAATPKGGE